MTLLELFRFQFDTFSDISDADINTALDISSENRLSGSKTRGDVSQCLYAAYLLSVRRRDRADAEHSSINGYGVQSMRLGDESRTFISGSNRADELLDPSGYLARYKEMQKEGGLFIASVGSGRGCRNAGW